MDKNKIKKDLKDVEAYLRMMQEKHPKLLNQLVSIGWLVRSIKEELDKPDEVKVEESQLPLIKIKGLKDN